MDCISLALPRRPTEALCLPRPRFRCKRWGGTGAQGEDVVTLTDESPRTWTQHMQRFIVLSQPRSGTHFLRGMLNSHPNIWCAGELLNPAHSCGNLAAACYLAYERKLPFRNRVMSRGFVIHVGHFLHGYRPEILDWLREDGAIRIVRLERRNVLRMVVSREVAERTGCWVAAAGTPLPPPAAIRIEPHRILRKIRTRLNERAAIDNANLPNQSLTVNYEELSAANSQRLLEFLGVSHQPLLPCTKRTGGQPLRNLLENYDAIRTCLIGTPFAKFLED